MLNRNVNVIFDDGSNTMTLTCSTVRFGAETLGKVKEKIDFELVEVFEDTRLLIEIKVKLIFSDALFILGFLQSTSKKLTIDGENIEVVNAEKQTWFDLFEDSIVAAFPTLKFKKKTRGMPDFIYNVAHMGKHIGVTT